VNLEGVGLADLTASPEALDAMSTRIDEHWTRVRKFMKEGRGPPSSG
jgi:hypothetical protein